MVSPVAGLMAGNVLPDTLSCHLPPISSAWSLTLGALVARGLLAVAVAMTIPPRERKVVPISGDFYSCWRVDCHTEKKGRQAPASHDQAGADRREFLSNKRGPE